jgi:DNA-binding IclR family transcriptional regulator
MVRAPQYPVPALEKGLDILEALAAAAVPLSLAELASQLGRSSSELFRMLNCLEVRGYISRDDLSGKYGLTLRLYVLAHTHGVTDKLLQAARRPMQGLTETFRESFHLSVLDQDQLVVVAQQESPERVRVSIEVGAVFDPVATASGRLLLAGLPEDRRGEVLSKSAAAARLSAKGRADLVKTLNAIRESGVSVAESETIEGVHDLAVLVGHPASGVTAALAVTRLLRRGASGDDPRLTEGMRRAAAAITQTLGVASLL